MIVDNFLQWNKLDYATRLKEVPEAMVKETNIHGSKKDEYTEKDMVLVVEYNGSLMWNYWY